MSSRTSTAYPLALVKFAAGFVKERTPRSWRHAVRVRMLAPVRRGFAGDGVECPVCGFTARRFVRGACAACGSGARPRLIAIFLKNEFNTLTRQTRILHFAPEPGLVSMLRSVERLTYVPADLYPAPGHERVDATAIHLPQGFDLVISSHVLEHIPNDAAAMAEMYRVLAPGGCALILVPVARDMKQTYEDPVIRSAWQRHRHFGQHDHVRVYGLDVAQRLESAGFAVHQRCYAKELSSAATVRYGLRDKDVLYLCYKT